MLYKKLLSKGLPNIKKKPGDVYIAILSHGKTPVSSEWKDFLWLKVPGVWGHVTATSCTMFFTDKLYRKRRLIKWAPLPVISQQMQTNTIGNSGQTNNIKTEAFSADLLRIFRKM
jgi:hypothetical protein